MKKLIQILTSIMLMIYLIFSFNSMSINGDSTKIELAIDDPYMYINGEQYEIDPGRGTYPVIVNSRTLLPIRAIVENLSGSIEWDEAEKRVSIKHMNKMIELWVDKNIISINEKQEQIDQPPVIINSRTMVPVRFVAENMGCEVIWHEEGKRVEIIKEEVIIVEDEEFYDKERPMFRGNLKHTGVYDTKGVHEGNEIKWKFEPEITTYDMIALAPYSPIIVENNIYIGCWDGNLYGINIDTGQKEFEFRTEGRIDSAPATDNRNIYFGSYDGNLYAVSIETCQEKWKYTTEGKICSSPAIYNDAVYFGSCDNNLYALDLKTGEEKWRFETSGWIVSSPAIYKGIVYFGSWDGNLYAVDALNGKEIWSFSINSHIYSSPAIDDENIYFGGQNGILYAADINTGIEKWNYKTGAKINSSPAIYKGVVYFGSGDGNLYALDAEIGFEKWRFETEVDKSMHGFEITNSIYSSPSIAENIIYFGCNNRYFYAIDIHTGEEKWKIKTEMDLWCSPVILNGVVYFTSDRFLYAITDKKTVEPWIDWD